MKGSGVLTPVSSLPSRYGIGTFDDGRTGMFRGLFSSLLEGASRRKPYQYHLLYDLPDCLEKTFAVNRDIGIVCHSPGNAC